MRRLQLPWAVALALILTPLVVGAADESAGATSTAPAVHHAGQTLAYVLHGHMTQSIDGHDPYGQKIHEKGNPAAIDGSEHISIRNVSTTTGDLTLRRTGTVVATVSGKHNKPSLRSGYTVMSPDGTIVRDNNKLGGIFLLPLPFLGDRAVRSGLDLSVGDSWDSKLGVKLFGMLASPMLRYQVVATRPFFGVNIYTISAMGSAPMKEPVVTTSGYQLGFASGTAWMTLHADYDAVNRRVVSMNVDVRDTLQLFGPNNKLAGTVRDHERYDVALDATSLMAGR